MGLIAQSSIEEIKDRASLVEVIGETVTLKRQGSSFVGLCPFHSEKSPSFHVRDNDHRYHCFGCGASGNVISFTMETKGISFREAVEELAARFGVALRTEAGTDMGHQKRDDKEPFLKAHALAQSCFLAALKQADAVVHRYLQDRGLQPATLTAFGVGLAPARRNWIGDVLRKQGVRDEVMLGAGLLRRNARGELYDGFRARLMFPIMLDRKHIVGFGGRILPALVDADTIAKAPKYLNSPENPAYQKNSVVYGLPQAMAAIRSERRIYLVEGYMDVLGLWQAGVQNVVATCGTAVTERHCQRLKHLAPRVVVLFDGDSAGREAAGKLFPLFVTSGIDVVAAFLPDGDDPDTFALRHGSGTAAALDALEQRTLLDCYIDHLVRRGGVDEARELGAANQAKIATELAGYIGSVSNAIERDQMAQHVAMRLRVDAQMLRNVVAGEPARTAAPTPAAAGVRSDTSANPVTHPAVTALPPSDRQVLTVAMALRERIVERLLRDSVLCSRLTPTTMIFLQALAEIVGTEESEERKRSAIKMLLHSLGQSWVDHWRSAHEMSRDQGVDMERIIDDCRAQLLNLEANQQIKSLQAQILTCATESEKITLSGEILAMRRRLTAGRTGGVGAPSIGADGVPRGARTRADPQQ